MQPEVVLYVNVAIAVVLTIAIGMHYHNFRRVTGGGSVASWIARYLTLAFGRITFGLLYLFERLWIDMTAVDEALAGWTRYAQELKNHSQGLQEQLEDALARIQQLIATDAQEDAAQAEALQQQIAEQITSALETVKNPPQEPGSEEPEEVIVPIVSDESEPQVDPEQA